MISAIQSTTGEKRHSECGRLAGLYRPRMLLPLVLLLLVLMPNGVLLGRRLLAMHHLKIGRDLLERYHQEEARPHLEACLRLWPGHAEVLLLLARTARRADVLKATEYYLAEYRQLHVLTEELTLEEILYSAAKGETDKVAKHCRQIVQTNGDATSLVLETMVQGYFRMHRLSEGFAVLQTWLEREPNNTQALLFQAGLYAVRLRRQEAVETYGRVLELDPDHDTARLRLALILMQNHKHDEALPHLQYLRLRQADNPIMPTVLVLLSRCLDYAGREDEGEQLREEVLTQYPHFGPAVGDRGRWALQHGRWADAETWLREALSSDPNNHDLHYQLARCLFKSGKNAEAEAELQGSERLEANLARVDAIANQELPRRPGDPALHLELGRLMLEQGRAEEGLYWLHRVLQRNPANRCANQALADHYQQIGDASRAAYHRRFLPNNTPERRASAP